MLKGFLSNRKWLCKRVLEWVGFITSQSSRKHITVNDLGTVPNSSEWTHCWRVFWEKVEKRWFLTFRKPEFLWPGVAPGVAPLRSGESFLSIRSLILLSNSMLSHLLGDMGKSHFTKLTTNYSGIQWVCQWHGGLICVQYLSRISRSLISFLFISPCHWNTLRIIGV